MYFLLSYKSYLNNQYKIGNIKLIYYIKQSNSVLGAVSLKKLKISTQQGSMIDSAQVTGRHVIYNSAPLMHRGNGEAFSELNRRASQASSSDVSRLFQRGQCSFGNAKL